MKSITDVKKQVKSFSVKYVPVDNPLDPLLEAMVYHDGGLKYSASCYKERIKIFCKEEDIRLIRNHLEESIKNKLAEALWIDILAEATSTDICC